MRYRYGMVPLLLTEISLTSNEKGAHIIYFIHIKVWDVISEPYSNVNQTTIEVMAWWVIYHITLPIHALLQIIFLM